MWKKFVITSWCFLAVFVLVNAGIFFGLRGGVPFAIGDLLRLGYMGSRYGNYQQTIKNQCDDIGLRYTEMKDFAGENSSFDVVVVGDSFSQQGRYGYQNFIAAAGYRVLNIPRFTSLNQIYTVYLLHQTGFFRKNGIKFVVVQIVERAITGVLQNTPTAKYDMSYEKVIERYKTMREDALDDEFFVNFGNLKFLLSNFLRKFSPNAFFSETYSMETSKNLFSTKFNELLFYRDDVAPQLFNARESEIQKFSETLGSLAKLLKEDGVKLIFLPAVNKYNIYKNLLVKNLGDFDMFPALRSIDENFYLCDSKKILSEKVERGEMDIFYADDTHWSWKASKYIADDIVRYISKP